MSFIKKVTVNENQRGLLFRNGRFVKLVEPGTYRYIGNVSMTLVNTSDEISCGRCSLETLLADKVIAEKTTVCEVADNEIALHFVNDVFREALTESGKHAFWSITDRHEFVNVDVSEPVVDESIPKYIFSKLPMTLYRKVDVPQYMKAIVMLDGKLHELLDAGTYYYWTYCTNVDVKLVDTRMTKLELAGQEMLTKDKVTLRINFVCNFRVTDHVRAFLEIDDCEVQLYLRCQTALRSFISGFELDRLLENKEEISEYVLKKLKEREDELFVNVTDAQVKDIILPGEIRDIMNTVLVAEKKAQANVITRREEVASTRSLLNTAKLMEENKTLWRLKEMEHIERVCANVDNISLGSYKDLLKLLGSPEVS